MKQKSRKSYWIIPIIIILLFVLAGCVRPVPEPDQPEGTATPVPQPTTSDIPTQVPSSPTPPTDGAYPGGDVAPTPEGGVPTDPNAGGGSSEVVVTEPTAVSPTLPTNHTVQAGETLYSISNTYGVSQEEIAAANNITTSSLLTVGQVLVIPAPGTATQPSQPTQPATGEQVHVVQPGENLFRISLSYGKTVDEVAAYNGITNPHFIYPGQVIRIP
ncbi:MAG: LysM peptidoglycan-binding domain-containing protein [Anaerolineae bacterium]|nr:LysM peptidoglycan-binding domain-containing protein [Anaerolineae bacterium]